MTLSDGASPILTTGDLVFFSGKGIASHIVKGFTLNRWSHVGMVVSWPGQTEPLMIEATRANDSADVLSGQLQSGVSLVSLSSKLAAYRGEIAFRRRQGDPLSPWQCRLLVRLCRTLWRRPYRDYVTCHALMTIRGCPRKGDYRGVFCSELVAELYRRMGWLSCERPAYHYVPASLASEALVLRQGTLSPLTPLKTNDGLLPDTLAIAQQIAGRETPLQPQLHAAVSPL